MIARRRWARVEVVVWLAALVAIVVARIALVRSWQAPAGDGVGYYKLSQALAGWGRFAFGPPPLPVVYTRMPGYPLFLAYVAVRHAPLDMAAHLVRATWANLSLDGMAAVAVWGIAREAKLRGARWAALIFLLCPITVRLASYGLGESLATTLTALTVWAAVRARSGRILVWAAAGGVALGLAGLTRVDSVALLPPIAWLLLRAPEVEPRRRWQALGLFVGVAGLVFLPWPVRNVIQFKAPHFVGTEFIDAHGEPLRAGFLWWQRTWGASRPGESYLAVPLANHGPLDPNRPGIVLPQMYDDEAEKAHVAALFHRYNQEGLSEGVDRELRALAWDRFKRHPVRCLVTLPVERVLAMWEPLPEYELPMRGKWFQLEGVRKALKWGWWGLLVVAGLGIPFALRQRESRAIAAALVGAIVVRCALLSWLAHPGPNQRYVAELMPLVAVLAIGLLSLRRREV